MSFQNEMIPQKVIMILIDWLSANTWIIFFIFLLIGNYIGGTIRWIFYGVWVRISLKEIFDKEEQKKKNKRLGFIVVIILILAGII